tara:strand:+ start:220 stop:420 length:201 start_codon:yes stop_codon:yes gene_type:complete
MKTKKVELSDELIAEAKAYLETLPKTPEEVIENWARLGQQVAGDMTEREAMNFLLGNVDIGMQAKK